MIFIGLVTVVLALAHWYLWKRLVKDTTAPGGPRRAGGWTLIGLGVLVIAALMLSRMISPSVARFLSWPAYIWLGLMFYLVLVLLVLEPPRLALRPWMRGRAMASTAAEPEPAAGTPERTEEPAASAESRRVFLARSAAAVAGVASVGLVGTGMVSALGPPEITRLSVPLRRLDPRLAGFRIAVVSDIHLGSLLGRGHTERIVSIINETGPDLVAIVGDLVDGTVEELGRSVEPLQDLVSGHGTYFVTGNHEYYSGYEPWMAELERLGVQPLRNERTGIQRGPAGFDLAGVNDLNGESLGDGPDLDRALAGRDDSRPVVLLSHQPVQVEDAAERKVDLQLSGHTHGGQLWPFHYVVRAAQPAVSGLSKVDETWLYVTNGAGFWGPPVRVGAPPEVSIVELTPG